MADEYKITLYRCTNPGDGISTTDKIEFNLTSKKKGDSEAAFGICEKKGQEGIGDNQAAGQPLSNLQALSKVEDQYIITGWVRRRIGDNNDGNNAILTKLATWEDEPKQSDNWPQGRFGIQINDTRMLDVVPVGTGTAQKGLILESVDWKPDNSIKIPRMMLTIRLRKSRGDGT